MTFERERNLPPKKKKRLGLRRDSSPARGGLRMTDLNPENVIESVLSSFADVFFCSMPIHRLFSKSPDKSGNYIIFENTNGIFRVK
jgi:hypothetical protein